VVCHGENGKGMTSVGAPNLTDNVWLYGGEREVVRDTLRHGRAGVMPEWETKLGNERIMLLASYIYSLSNNNVNATAPKAVQEPRDAQPAEMKSEQATVDTDKS
jgi:cytochrome c oxidase cbb3-type subunit 3